MDIKEAENIKMCNDNAELEECPELQEEFVTYFEPIPIFKEYLEDIGYDEDEFENGVNSISFDCGQITALLNIGLSIEDALAYLTNKLLMQNSIDLAKINQNTSVLVAKEQSIQTEKNTL